MNLLHFGASNSRNSINKLFAHHTAHRIGSSHIKGLDLNDFEMPLYSIDREKETGIPSLATDFAQLLEWADAVVISFAEHNGSYSVAFKNIFDWTSRLKTNPWQDKQLLLLATSPGQRGGVSVLKGAVARLPFMGAQVVASFSLPSFHTNFDASQGITNPELASAYDSVIEKFTAEINASHPLIEH